MQKKLLVALTVCAMTALGVAVAAKSPPKIAKIAKCGSKKGQVTFNHQQHSKALKIACVTCHHTAKDKKSKKDAYKPCASCHTGKKSGKKPGCAEMSAKKNPYHMQCVGCHKKLKKGPRRCKQCHKK